MVGPGMVVKASALSLQALVQAAPEKLLQGITSHNFIGGAESVRLGETSAVSGSYPSMCL